MGPKTVSSSSFAFFSLGFSLVTSRTPAAIHRRSTARASIGDRLRPSIPTNSSALIAIIADEDTVTGFLLAGVGNVDLRKKTNYLIVDNKTTVKQIEDAFKEFTTREDIAIVLISQYVANMIRFLVDSYNRPVPAILEIPSKDHPYDPAHDSVLSRVKYLFSAESVASDRR
uniref:V-type proton ATPase subunit F n=1 Tax=Oryza nivara TaxID=4536 RepID=A0A0E0GF50_ORYNI